MTQDIRKILVATPLYPPESGGPATYSKLLEEYLPAEGFSVELLAFSAVRHMPKGVRHVAYFWRCLQLARGADVVYALDPVSVGFPAAVAAMCARKPLVIRVPGDYAWEQGRQRFGVKEELDAFQKKSYGLRVGILRIVQNFSVRSARLVIAPSAYMQKIVSGWRAKNVHVVYSSIETPQPALIARPQGFLVVTAARRVPWKGVEALSRVVAREPSWTFKLCEEMPRAETLGWIKAADVFVLNSTYEGLSHALLEAMMLGTPIVATRTGGNPELIEDGVDGLLVLPGDDGELFSAIKKVEVDPQAARARAASARAKSLQFSIQKTTGQIAALLKSI